MPRPAPYRRRSRPPVRAPRQAAPVATAIANGGLSAQASATTQVLQKILLPRALSVSQLAERLGHTPIEVIKALMKDGIMATVNQVVDFQAAASAAVGFGFEAEVEARTASATAARAAPTLHKAGALARPPVVTIMGHVDHGKTTLLDAIRKANVAATEVGQITQHIGAYQVEIQGQKITFLDTPGHEAFTSMRARGARLTDIAVLVVAADDGVMPQTVEAIDHARAAGVPIVVALNKIDKPEANPDRVKAELGEHGLLLEEWGGDVICVPVSAKQRLGLDDLLANLLVVAEVGELKANPSLPARGAVVEAKLDPNRGPVATVLVQDGTLKVGDTMVVGDAWGKVKAMMDDRGQRLTRAGPSTPAAVLGLNQVPLAGGTFEVVPDERSARQAIDKRQSERAAASGHGLSLRDVYAQATLGMVKDLNVILKTDVQGSIEPIRGSLERLATDQLQVRIIHAATGSITESDVLLAVASKGIILGFNSRPEPGARQLAETEGIDIRSYDLIHTLVDDVNKALKGLLEPVSVEVILGHGEIRAVFSASRQGKVAGVAVTDGRIQRGSKVRVLRKGLIIKECGMASLRRLKDDVREVAEGFECGLTVAGFDGIMVGDIVEAFEIEKIARKLE